MCPRRVHSFLRYASLCPARVPAAVLHRSRALPVCVAQMFEARCEETTKGLVQEFAREATKTHPSDRTHVHVGEAAMGPRTELIRCVRGPATHLPTRNADVPDVPRPTQVVRRGTGGHAGSRFPRAQHFQAVRCTGVRTQAASTAFKLRAQLCGTYTVPRNSALRPGDVWACAEFWWARWSITACTTLRVMSTLSRLKGDHAQWFRTRQS